MSKDLTFISMFIAGVISFISPCVLPLVPPYLTYLAGISINEIYRNSDNNSNIKVSVRNKVLINASFFVLGFSFVFISLGVGVSSIGLLIRSYRDILSIIAGFFIILMGLHFLKLVPINLFDHEARFQLSDHIIKRARLSASFLMGLAFAFGWTPCIGPVLATILGVASTSDSIGQGAIMLAIYSAGLGFPFLLASVFLNFFMNRLKYFKQQLIKVEQIMGSLLILTGIVFLKNGTQTIAFFLIDFFPLLTNNQ
ncbi:cytochrome c biogenesis CcdA family protein [Candidatus Endowatersipora endosymbiont of Watersipora subatra]|uniref:cytochrome c biogenesis CcdA family protein n=1 Tax=Candidatus Endowatersipora endosymbiont of Watersipora subatra TaxID=3077946 RepID=UPI00312CAB62